MNRSVFFFIFIFLFSLINKAISTPIGEVHPTKHERKIAKNLMALLNLSRSGHINYQLAKKLKQDIKGSITFHSYIIWPENVLKINKADTLSRVISTCSQIQSQPVDDPVQEELLSSSLSVCFNKYLRLLSQNSNKSIGFHEKERKFFEQSTQYFLNNTNFDELKFFLSRFKKQSSKLKLYSKVIEDHYISKNENPPKHLLGYLNITNKLSSFIQNNHFERDENQYIFFESLIQLKSEIIKLADQKKPLAKEVRNIISFINNNKEALPLQRSLSNLLSIGKSLSRRNLYAQSRICFDAIITIGTDYKEEAIFEKLWSYTTQEKYDDAIENVVQQYHKEMSHDSRFTFWSGISYLEENQKEKAYSLFKSVIDMNPLSYYAILSSKMTKQEKALEETKGRYYASIKNATTPAPQSQLDHRWLRRIHIFAELSESTLLRAELSKIHAQAHDAGLASNLLFAAKQLAENGNYIESFKIIYKSMNQKNIPFSMDVLSILFPNLFTEELSEMDIDFDPVIALSLIRQESGFNKKAVSRVGARGLMQLMPNTAKQFKKNLKISHLYDPSTNLKIGTKYLQGLMQRYDNNLVLSLAAYNAGESRVDSWKEKYLNNKSILHDIENIPFNETRKYVKLIFRNIFFYKMIAKTADTDSSSLNKIYDVNLGFQ